MEITDNESGMPKNVRALVLPHTSSQWPAAWRAWVPTGVSLYSRLEAVAVRVLESFASLAVFVD
jgi:isopenicillin N synthase-like dioxygenase